MKTLTSSNPASPFILLLIPVLICAGLLWMNRDKEVPADRTAVYFIPTVKAFFTQF